MYRSGGQAWCCRARIPHTKKAHPAAPDQNLCSAAAGQGSTTSAEGGVLGADLLKALAKRWRTDVSR